MLKLHKIIYISLLLTFLNNFCSEEDPGKATIELKTKGEGRPASEAAIRKCFLDGVVAYDILLNAGDTLRSTEHLARKKDENIEASNLTTLATDIQELIAEKGLRNFTENIKALTLFDTMFRHHDIDKIASSLYNKISYLLTKKKKLTLPISNLENIINNVREEFGLARILEKSSGCVIL